ncbi:hypothetical protein BD779DRAFT_1447187 [Infundibulicybe gibba]|nr:hypothetical protein BD779DRAFT_1447187 [Infundibulicybe gibba]
MGSSQSILTSESAITAAVVAGFIGIGYAQIRANPTVSAGNSSLGPDTGGKKGKKKGQSKKAGTSDIVAVLSEVEPVIVQFPAVIPGQFEPASATPTAPEGDSIKPKKPKKKKAKSLADDPAPAQDRFLDSSSQSKSKGKKKQQAAPSSQHLEQSTLSVDTDGSWTRVNSRHRPAQTSGDKYTTADLTSDTGITTSVTGNSSPIAERTEDEASMYYSRESSGNQRTLAEKLLPKPRKTKVADMLETPDYPTLARVIHVRPPAEETPVPGFSWGDYEDTGINESGGAENDADGEDDGWGVVKSKHRSSRKPTESGRSPSTSQQLPAAPQELTKKQRQNANKRDAQKAAKVAAESERLALLAKHKRELERAKITEQYSKKGSSKTPSGGMSATVDSSGKLVWE